MGVGLGYVGCITESCRDESPTGDIRYRGGALGQLEFGYRAGRIAPSIAVAMGGGPMKYTEELAGLEGTMRFLDIGAGVMFFPMKKGRIDPYVGLRFGYARAREHFTLAEADAVGDFIYSRYGLRLSAGVGFYVLPMLAIGPRFDLTLPVSGHVCGGVRQGDFNNTECFDASSVIDSNTLPRWWSLSLGMHLVLPRRAY